MIDQDHSKAEGDTSPGPQKLRRAWLWAGWALIAAVVFESLTPKPIQIPGAQGDKFAHLLAYLVLMLWFATLYRASARRAGLALAFVLMGIGLEFAQRWTGIRSFEIPDMVSGALGVALGWLLAPPRLPNGIRIAERLITSAKWR